MQPLWILVHAEEHGPPRLPASWITCFLKTERDVKLCPPHPPCPVSGMSFTEQWHRVRGTREGERERQCWGTEDLHCLGRSNTRTPHRCFGFHLDICFLDHSNGIHHIYITHHASARYSSLVQGCSFSPQSLAIFFTNTSPQRVT